MPLSHEEIARYSRHLLLPDVGVEGQEKLINSSVLIVGTGGLGSPVAMYLAAAGVGKIGIVDHDLVDDSNLQRQVIHGSTNVGMSKVESAENRLRELNPLIEINTYDLIFNSANAFEVAEGYDLIIDGTDNFPTRYLINDLCVLLKIPNIYGSVYRFDGQVSIFDAKEGPCYRCVFPEPPPPGMVPSCEQGGVLGVLPGTIGTLQATEAIKTLLNIGSNLTGRMLLYNALDLSFDFINLRKNPNCKVCSPNPVITKLIEYEAFCGIPIADNKANLLDKSFTISVNELAVALESEMPPALIDVRESHELNISKIDGAILIPLGQFAGRIEEIDPNSEVVLMCKTGIRSARALEILMGAGYQKVKNLEGGINQWAEEINPQLPKY